MPFMEREGAVVARVSAWQCIGCGKVEAPQNCIGVCQDRKVEFVYASDYEAALAQIAHARQRVLELETLAHQIAWTTPRAGEWERSYRALQDKARRIFQVA